MYGMNGIVLVVLAAFIELTAQAEWTYEDESHWPGVCRSGLKQSPINIESQRAVVDSYGVHLRGPLVFRGYRTVKVKGVNNGHTLKWSVATGPEEPPPPVVSGGPLRGNYTFKQFHLHWLSEHAVDGLKYPLEIHMVHVKTGLTVEEALTRHDGLAVIGVLCEVKVDKGIGSVLDELVPMIPDLFHRSADTEGVINIRRLLSPDPQSYYSYSGSLTTPGCQEAVIWIVMDQPATIFDSQYKLLSMVDIGGSVYNSRSLQSSASRVVYRSGRSCAVATLPGLLNLLGALVSCSSSHALGFFQKTVCLVSNLKRKIYGGTVQDCTKPSVGYSP